ncbi:MAG: bifunctional hydroxymethylpyrimidine kinase/phosphomethylpyrimidine kinase [bacterium]
MLPRVLTIAGSDSSGGAGIQADLKTFTVFRTYGMSAITALTAQNTRGVSGIFAVPPEFVRAQIDAVADDIGIDAAKTGMLANAPIIAAVAAAVRAHRIAPLVVDPVMVAQSGARLLQDDARAVLLAELLPLATVVTPNVPEAEALLAMAVPDIAAMREAARRLVALGARAALIKGGHLDGAEAVDVLYDGSAFHELRAPRRATPHTHGTGCMTAAALTACLARGLDLVTAAHEAKRFITRAIAHGLALGGGNGPANPLVWLDEEEDSTTRKKI